MCDDAILSAHILRIIVQLRAHYGVRNSSTNHGMRNGWIKAALFASHLGPAMLKAPALVTSPSVGKNDFHTRDMYCAMPSVSTSEITSAGSAGCTLPVGAQRLAGATPTSWHLVQEAVQNVWLNVNTSEAVQAWDLASNQFNFINSMKKINNHMISNKRSQQRSKCTRKRKHLHEQFQTLSTKVLAISQFCHQRLQINQPPPQTFCSFHSVVFMLCNNAINGSCNQRALSPIACQQHVSSSTMPKKHSLVSSANISDTSIPCLGPSSNSLLLRNI